tara:strand:- start:1809 stop:2066 length:258 start_codon:yes stop_codon:yes gene_type:complete
LPKARRGDKGSEVVEGEDPVCPVCLRPIPPGARQSLHHLVRKLKGGKGGAVVQLHQICHSEIHARFTESQLARASGIVRVPDMDG